MKPKKIQLISLLLLAALVGCGKTSDTTKPNTGDTNTTTATADTSNKKPTSVAIDTSRNYIYINETLTLGAAFEPANTSEDFRLVSSAPDIIEVTGNSIKGISATDENEEVTITLTTDSGLTASTKFVVYDPIERMKTLLTDAHTLALKEAVSGDLQITSSEEGQDGDLDESYVYNIYKNSSELTAEVTDGTQPTITTVYNRAIIDGRYVESMRRKKGTGDFEDVNGYLENRPIVDTVTEERYQYTKEQAEERIANLPVCSDKTIGVRGLEGFVISDFFENVSSFGSVYAKNELHIEENLSDETNIYTLSYDYTVEKSQIRTAEELTIEFDQEGFLLNVNDTITHYSGEGLPEVAKSEIKAAQIKGTRDDAPTDAFNFEQYYFTNFDIVLHNDEHRFDWNAPCDTSYYVGETANLVTYEQYINAAPSTARTSIDPIRIVSVSDPEVATIENSGYRLKFNKLAKDVVVTVATTMSKIEKTITLHCVSPTVTKIQFGEFTNPGSNWASYTTSSSHYLPYNWITDEDKEVWVVGAKYQEVPDITVTSSNKDVATVEMVEGETNKFTFHPIKAGKTTIKVVDSTLGEAKAITKEVTIYENTDIGIADLLKESTVTHPFNQSLYGNFKFSGEKGTNKGDFSGLYDPDGSKIGIWGSWIVEDGTIKATTYSGAFGKIEYGSVEFVLDDISFSNFSKYGPNSLIIKGSSQQYGELGEGVGTGVVLD